MRCYQILYTVEIYRPHIHQNEEIHIIMACYCSLLNFKLGRASFFRVLLIISGIAFIALNKINRKNN